MLTSKARISIRVREIGKTNKKYNEINVCVRVGRISLYSMFPRLNPTHHSGFLHLTHFIFVLSLIFSDFFIDLNFIVLNSFCYAGIICKSRAKKRTHKQTRAHANEYAHKIAIAARGNRVLEKFQHVENLFSRYQDRSRFAFVCFLLPPLSRHLSLFLFVFAFNRLFVCVVRYCHCTQSLALSQL